MSYDPAKDPLVVEAIRFAELSDPADPLFQELVRGVRRIIQATSSGWGVHVHAKTQAARDALLAALDPHERERVTFISLQLVNVDADPA